MDATAEDAREEGGVDAADAGGVVAREAGISLGVVDERAELCSPPGTRAWPNA